MRTLGIDLAAQDRDTAYCAIEWLSCMALVERPVVGASDTVLLDEMKRAAWTGIDAPFGWPDDFVAAVHGYAHEGAWPKPGQAKRMSHRETDRFVHEIVKDETNTSMWPLSVSSDRIAVCAWRCANLLREHADATGWQIDRIGVPLSTGMDGPPDGPRPNGVVAERGVVEVYPAAALALWGLPHRGYKSRAAASRQKSRDLRVKILADLERIAGGCLVLSEDVREAAIETDHALDALVSSLVGCAAATDRTLHPTLVQRGAAQREGWIHLPAPGSIFGLAPGTV